MKKINHPAVVDLCFNGLGGIMVKARGGTTTHTHLTQHRTRHTLFDETDTATELGRSAVTSWGTLGARDAAWCARAHTHDPRPHPLVAPVGTGASVSNLFKC